MKIVYLHHANVCKAGIERMLAQKANLLAKQMGWEVVLLTYEQNGEPFPFDLSPKVRQVDLGVRLYSAFRYTYPLRLFKKKRLRSQLSLLMKDFLVEHNPDVVVSTDKDGGELSVLYAAVRAMERETGKKRCRLIVEAHTGFVDHEMQIRRAESFQKRLVAAWSLRKLKEIISKYDVLVALTADDAKRWNPFIRTTVIPNFLSYHPTPQDGHPEEHKRIVAVGRLDYQKGYDLLLRAWLKVEQAHPDWRLDIFGDGEEKPKLLSQMAAEGLRNVTFHPVTTNIYGEYRKSDFLVCSSRWESFGLVLIEAMACGIPAVSFDCDNGPRNIIADGEDGLLVKKCDVEELAVTVCRMIEHKAMRLRMGAAACKNITRFQEKTIIEQYLAFLTKEVGSES